MKPVHQTNVKTIRSEIGPLHPNSTTDHRQTRPPNQTTRTDQPTRQQTTILQTEQHTQLLEMVQVRCFLYGLGQGGYIELWMNLAKHTFHTLSAWSFRTFFRLNLTLFSLASGVPWAGKGLPFPFSLDGFLCRCSVSNKNSAFRNRFGFLDSASIQGNGSVASFCAFSDGRHHRCFSRRRRRLHYDLPLSCANLNWSITLHLTVYALGKWSFHSQGSTRLWLF